jgi:ABC-2 type transport system ATP-binding protein
VKNSIDSKPETPKISSDSQAGNVVQEDVICCEKLTKHYPGGVVAVNGVDLRVHRGEIFGLLGPNGAGKTTTVGMLTTLVVPTSGKVKVSGIDVITHPTLVKQLIGVVAQTNNLDRALTVWENLYYHGRYFGMSASQSREAADHALVEFHLTQHAGVDVSAISGGMAKRLQVARSLMHEPSVLFLDEPTAGLDPQSRLALWDILVRLHTQGQTILVTTHYMEEADMVCERVAIMDHGNILALDTPKNLKETVAEDTVITVAASGDLNVLSSLYSKMIDGVSRIQRIGESVQLRVKGVAGVLPKVVEIAEQGGFKINDLTITGPTLETVFIKLTGRELRE